MLAFLSARAAPAVEAVIDGVYTRTLSIGGHAGVISIGQHTDRPALRLTIGASLLPVLLPVVATVRRLFDLDAEPERIVEHLEAVGFGKISAADRGLRVPGAADPFELAIRAILGQQVSVKGASTLMSRLTHTFGVPFAAEHASISYLPVSADRIAASTPARVAKIGLPLARATTIRMLARHVADGTLRIEPDAFPASDLVLRRSAGNLTPAQLLRAADAWRPWRAYAAMHLWRRK